LRIMAIDIGTNTTLHLVADIDVERLEIVERGLVGSKLGLGLINGNRLTAETIDNHSQIFSELTDRAANLGCQKIGAVGTHALRIALNRNSLVEMAAEAGLDLRVISAQEEAQLGWTGHFDMAGSSAPTALLDIGGGSSELSIGSGTVPNWTSSIPVGGLNITKLFFHHDPPIAEEIFRAKNYIDSSYRSWKNVLDKNCPLIGVSGVMTSIAAIQGRISNYSPGIFEGITLNGEYITSLKDRLIVMSKAERAALPGMPEHVIGSIHASVMIVEHVLNLLSVGEIVVSERGVLFGLAFWLSKN